MHTTKSGYCWCKLCCVEASLASNRRLKEEVFSHYGGKCSICNEADIDVLTLDHIDQQGSEHRRANKIGTGQETWRWVKKQGFPAAFRVLCFNCNTKAWRKFLRKQKELQMIKEAITVAEEFNHEI